MLTAGFTFRATMRNQRVIVARKQHDPHTRLGRIGSKVVEDVNRHGTAIVRICKKD